MKGRELNEYFLLVRLEAAASALLRARRSLESVAARIAVELPLNGDANGAVRNGRA